MQTNDLVFEERLSVLAEAYLLVLVKLPLVWDGPWTFRLVYQRPFLEPSLCRNGLSYSQTWICNPSALYLKPNVHCITNIWEKESIETNWPLRHSMVQHMNWNFLNEQNFWCKRASDLTCSPRTVVYNEGTLLLVKAKVAILICVASSLRPASTWHSISALLRKYGHIFVICTMHTKNTSHNEDYLHYLQYNMTTCTYSLQCKFSHNLLILTVT